jgi:2-polyprenyl-6-hydroxyphenyl methylase / 3-demethylubiquinone-9 3-methyltransferase
MARLGRSTPKRRMEGSMRVSHAAASVDDAEIARFSAIGEDWWNPQGSMRALHRINPLRIGWLRDQMTGHFQLERGASAPLAGLSILDIGCGAGLLAEPLSRLGADVTGLDPAPGNIEVARRHAEETGATLTYRAATLEQLVLEPRRFDVVLAMEVVEHVNDMPGFVANACSLVGSGGLFAASTLNRTFTSFALAIIGAEFLLGWVPRGTHRWEQFVTPEELAAAVKDAGLKITRRSGVIYDPLRGDWRLSGDMSVNYMVAARR